MATQIIDPLVDEQLAQRRAGGGDHHDEVWGHSRQKLQLYSNIGVRELLLIDRAPWALEICKLERGRLRLSGRSTLESPIPVQTNILPPDLRLVPGAKRPLVEIAERAGKPRWQI